MFHRRLAQSYDVAYDWQRSMSRAGTMAQLFSRRTSKALRAALLILPFLIGVVAVGLYFYVRSDQAWNVGVAAPQPRAGYRVRKDNWENLQRAVLRAAGNGAGTFDAVWIESQALSVFAAAAASPEGCVSGGSDEVVSHRADPDGRCRRTGF